MIKNYFKFFLYLIISGIAASGLNAEIRVEAFFDPSTITIANSTTYKVIIHGSQQGSARSTPSVNGLRFSSPPRTLWSASFINGVPSVRFELSYTVVPEREGTFLVPEWELNAGNSACLAPAAKLVVLAPNENDKLRLAQNRKQQADLKQAAFLEFSCPRPFLFEGETVDAQISLFLWNRLPVTRIEQVPQKNGSGFSMSELGQPNEQRNVKRFNKLYTVYSWNLGLTGALPGKQSLAFKSIIRIRVRNNRNSSFSNPFFNDPFFGFGREEGLEIISDSLNLEIRPLPNAKRPSNFQGAIGNLSISSVTDKDRVSVGDPVRLTCTINGSGNFAAMPAPKVSLGQDFKIGPPAFSFSGNELTKHSGSQSFEYIITPLNAGLLEVPPITFSFFNPETEQYVSLRTNSLKIRVDPGEIWNAPQSSVAQATKEVPATSKELFQTESDPGEWISRLALISPLKSTPFWMTQLLLLALFIAIILIRFNRRNPRLEARKQKEKLLEAKTRDALKHKDISGFHQALRRRIRQRVGIVCDHPNASALSSTEIIKLLKNYGYSEDILSEILELLNICDDMEYAALSSEGDDIESTFQKSQAVLKNIK